MLNTMQKTALLYMIDQESLFFDWPLIYYRFKILECEVVKNLLQVDFEV